MMIELLRVHGADHEPVVRARGHVRKQVAEVHAALAMLRERPRRTHEPGGLLLDEGEAHVLRHRFRQRLPVQLIELGLGVEKIHLRGSALHEDADAILRLGREMRLPRFQWIFDCERRGRRRGDQPLFRQQRTQRQRTDAIGGRREKTATGLMSEFEVGVHGLKRLLIERCGVMLSIARAD